MAYVITKACLGSKDRSCVEVCPVDCIYDIRNPELNAKYGAAWAKGDAEHKDPRNAGMLMIHPDECINCGACISECPTDAIYEDTDVPENLEEFIKLNQDTLLAMNDEELDQARCTSRE